MRKLVLHLINTGIILKLILISKAQPNIELPLNGICTKDRQDKIRPIETPRPRQWQRFCTEGVPMVCGTSWVNDSFAFF